MGKNEANSPSDILKAELEKEMGPLLPHTNSTVDEFLVGAYPGAYPEKEEAVKKKRAMEEKQTSQRTQTDPTGHRKASPESAQVLTPSPSANSSFSGSISSFFRSIMNHGVAVLHAADDNQTASFISKL